jgi:high-affinity K+ transport system ATPase subunit B
MSAAGKLVAGTETTPAPAAPPGGARPSRGLFDPEILGRARVAQQGGAPSAELDRVADRIARSGATPLAVADGSRLHSAQSAVLSAVIFNALVIVALIPLALRGVRFRPSGAAAILRRNVFIYGIGGIIVPFIFIKLIDLILTATGLF